MIGAGSYFPDAYWAPSYWPKLGATDSPDIGPLGGSVVGASLTGGSVLSARASGGSVRGGPLGGGSVRSRRAGL